MNLLGIDTSSMDAKLHIQNFETVLLGVVAARVGAKNELKWNSGKLKFENSDKANGFIREKYRKGWEVEGLG